ncbi:MAG: hypothetical protein Q7J59_03480 [Elusimicrobiota bacterium]|nr:hypothetical protein [Elusimicrobiota bacterium]
MRKDFKIFIIATVLGGVIWTITGAAFMLLNNGFAISTISGFFAAAGSAALFYMSKAPVEIKANRNILFFASSAAVLTYFALVVRHMLKITSGEVALTAALFILVCLIYSSAEIILLWRDNN